MTYKQKKKYEVPEFISKV